MEREIRNDQQFDHFILRCNGLQLAALAQLSYAQHGRGAVLIDLAVETEPGHTIARYLPAAQLVERMRGSTNGAELERFRDDLHTYDPERTILIVVERPGGVWHPYRIEIAALALAQSRPVLASAA